MGTKVSLVKRNVEVYEGNNGKNLNETDENKGKQNENMIKEENEKNRGEKY